MHKHDEYKDSLHNVHQKDISMVSTIDRYLVDTKESDQILPVYSEHFF